MQPTTLRVMSPQAPEVVMPTRVQALEDLGDVLEPDPVDLEALARRAVDDAAAEVLGDRGHRLDLVGAQLSLDDLDAHHEMPVAGVVRVEAVPLEEADVVGAQRLPPLARGAKQLGEDVEAVRFRLDAFDLAHGVRRRYPPNGRITRIRSGFTCINPIGFRRDYASALRSCSSPSPECRFAPGICSSRLERPDGRSRVGRCACRGTREAGDGSTTSESPLRWTRRRRAC